MPSDNGTQNGQVKAGIP